MNQFEREALKAGDKVAIVKYTGRFSRVQSVLFATVKSVSQTKIKTDQGVDFRVSDGCVWGVEKYSWRDDTSLYSEKAGESIKANEELRKRRVAHESSKRSILAKMSERLHDDSDMTSLMAEMAKLIADFAAEK